MPENKVIQTFEACKYTCNMDRKFLIVQKDKKRCIDFDSDCLLVSNHCSCWVYDKTKGFCPFLQNSKNDLIYINE
jgi:UDP-N-acetylglucosamine pyrophosphorylase